jgi:hypothetical protein
MDATETQGIPGSRMKCEKQFDKLRESIHIQFMSKMTRAEQIQVSLKAYRTMLAQATNPESRSTIERCIKALLTEMADPPCPPHASVLRHLKGTR